VKRPDHEAADQPYPVLSNRTITWAAVALILFGGGLATILLITFGDGRHDAQLEAIKTAGTIVLGTGGAAALWLTARRQRTSEIALIQKHLDQQAIDRAHQLQEEVARTTNADAESRRITELYGRAVDQLGSDKAPVRLGGLYALRRLAQYNPEQRQTIVDVLCAYLRMPYEAAAGTQEEQVRLAAERVLAKHHLLERNRNRPEPRDTDELQPFTLPIRPRRLHRTCFIPRVRVPRQCLLRKSGVRRHGTFHRSHFRRIYEFQKGLLREDSWLHVRDFVR
jgi:hypothetical protein